MTTPQTSTGVMRRRLVLIATLVGCVVAIVVVSMWDGTQKPRRDAAQEVKRAPSSDDLLEQARGELASGQFTEAVETANKAIGANPKNVGALLVSAEAATKLGQMEQAVAIYSRVPESQPNEYVTARFAAAEIERVAGSVDASIELYRQVLDKAPDHPLATDRLAGVLSMTGNMLEAKPLLIQMIQTRTCRMEHLQWLADPERSVNAPDYLLESLKRRPNQAGPHLGVARIEIAKGEFQKALDHLIQARAIRPQSPEIEAAYGRILLDLGRDDEWNTWLASLPPAIKTHPKVWLQQGLAAEACGQRDAACRCCLESIAIDPIQREAVYRGARMLVDLGKKAEATTLLNRNSRLEEISTLAGYFNPNQPSSVTCQRLAELLRDIGRFDESLAWASFAMRITPTNRAWFEKFQTGLQATLANPEKELVASIDRLRPSFPLPNFEAARAAMSGKNGTNAGQEISFIEEARQVGVDFTYMESSDPTTEGRRMFEMTGGGAVVLDYDQDGWPDLYFTQGATMVNGVTTGITLDQIFRNRGGKSFVNVTEQSGIFETGYSQGGTAGDFNNDGFPDVYVANFGLNRLFENLGDGTFEEVSLPADSAWTTSVAIADLNGDSIPDIYDVNYVQGEDTLNKTCSTPGGKRICTPYAFEAAPDRLLLGNGDGTFRDVSATADINPPYGKGLGLVVGQLDGQPGLDLFIANDTVANSLYVNDQPPGLPPHFRETATLAGVAFGDDGRPQACMGVAAGDFNRDGHLDLHVTNFANESNDLYLGNGAGAFEEASRSSGIRGPSLPMLGFGTQGIDVDRDGDLDLVVTNGDIDDFTHEGRKFKMRPQLYLNNQGHFRDMIPSQPNDYFSVSSAHRGRGLAKLDWNQDGREDILITMLDEPASLVTNHTPSTGKTITVRVIGTASARDAIGASVTLTLPGKEPQVAFVTSGDGFQARNEAVVRFYVPEAAESGELVVHWPNGMESRTPTNSLNANYYLTEP